MPRAADPAAAPDAVRRKRRHPGDADEADEGDEAFLDCQGFGGAPPPGNGMLDGGAGATGYETSDDEEEVCILHEVQREWMRLARHIADDDVALLLQHRYLLVVPMSPPAWTAT